MKDFTSEKEYYKRLNAIARKGGVVLFGSSFAKEIPVCELNQTFGLNCDIYNRSFNDLSVFDASDILEESISSLSPDKILIQLGETDIKDSSHTYAEVISEYGKLLDTLKNNYSDTEIVIVSLCCEADSDSSEFNSLLKKLAEEKKCQYADISKASANEIPIVKAFSILKYYIRDSLSFYEVMNAYNY